MATTFFISELHYDNVGGDTGKSVEIHVAVGTALSYMTVTLYKASGGAT